MAMTILSVTRPLNIFVYSVLECINTTSMHTISAYFIPYIAGPLGERILSTILSSLLFHQREVVVILTVFLHIVV